MLIREFKEIKLTRKFRSKKLSKKQKKQQQVAPDASSHHLRGSKFLPDTFSSSF